MKGLDMGILRARPRFWALCSLCFPPLNLNPQTLTNMLSLPPKAENRRSGCAERLCFQARSWKQRNLNLNLVAQTGCLLCRRVALCRITCLGGSRRKNTARRKKRRATFIYSLPVPAAPPSFLPFLPILERCTLSVGR